MTERNAAAELCSMATRYMMAFAGGAAMLNRVLRIVLASAFGSWVGSSAALAENRIALVIGNSAYQSVTPLPNPANDAKAMTELLRSASFEVITAPDLTQSAMRRTIGDFAEKVAAKGPDTTALVFYGGHGVQVDGENYLVPVDAHIQREADVPLQAVRLADLMNALSSVPSRTRIVMLDACRNNPFSEINKVAGRGLAIVDAPNGSIVSYSTSPGSEAEDGEGANSPYTTALLTVAKDPGVPIEQAFKRVRASVHQATKGYQTPWESSSLTAEFSFFPGVAGVTPPPPPRLAAQLAAAPAKTVTRSVDSWRKELQSKRPQEAYDLVIREDTVEAYQAYLLLYGSQATAAPVRKLMDRRRVMIAWYVATTTNTPASYATFMSQYQASDLAFTAQRLLDRARTRSFIPEPQIATTCICPTPTKPAEIKREKRTKRTGIRRVEEEVVTPAPRVVRPVEPVTTPVIIDIHRIPIRPVGPSIKPHGPSGPSGPHGPSGESHGPSGTGLPGGGLIGPR
jgi:uncharacterized caspase-like protein